MALDEEEGAATGVDGEGDGLTPDDGGTALPDEGGGEPDNDDPDGSGASDEDRVAESLAAELGWSPKDKWRGDEKDWKPARTFLKTTIEVNKARGREIKSLNERVERIARTSAMMAEKAAAEARSEVEARFAKAVEEGDTEAALRASQQLQSLSKPVNDAPSVVTEFVERNKDWYKVDPIATQMAIGICQLHADRGADEATQLAEAEKVIRKRFPEYFEAEQPKPQAKQPGAEVPGSRAAPTAKKGPKGFNDLPPEAKTAAKDFLKRGRIASLEEFAKIYFEEDA